MGSEQPDRLDTLIDEVARAATGAEPSGQLRTRVRQRIEMPLPSRGAWWPRAAMVTAAAAAAVVIAAVWPSDDRERASATQPPSTVAGPARASREPDTATADRTAPSAPQAIARRTPPVRAALRQVTAPVRGEDAVAIAPLAIEPLQPEDIDLGMAALFENVEIDPISVRPLAVGPLEIENVQ